MSTATFAPTGAAAADPLAAAKTIRDQAVAAAMWPVTLAKRVLAAVSGGWRAAYGLLAEGASFVKDALNAVPTSVKSVLLAAPFSTEGGYERVRSSFYWVARKALTLVSMGTVAALGAISYGAVMATGLVGMINKNAATKMESAILATTGFVGRVVTSVVTKAASVVDYVFVTLGHRTAVTTVTTGATAITALVGAEALSILGVQFGLLPTTLSGFIAGTPILAGIPLVPAMLTSVGVVAVSLLTLVAVGGVTAFVFKRNEINDIIAEDKAFAEATVTIPGEVVDAEVEQLITEAREAQVTAEVAKEIINQARNHGGKRHK
jgi:hypothetical protein